MKFTILVETQYTVDSEDLKQRFPDEYIEFLKENYPTDDRAWVEDCVAMGGFELLDFVDIDYSVDPV